MPKRAAKAFAFAASRLATASMRRWRLGATSRANWPAMFAQPGGPRRSGSAMGRRDVGLRVVGLVTERIDARPERRARGEATRVLRRGLAPHRPRVRVHRRRLRHQRLRFVGLAVARQVLAEAKARMRLGDDV